MKYADKYQTRHNYCPKYFKIVTEKQFKNKRALDMSRYSLLYEFSSL